MVLSVNGAFAQVPSCCPCDGHGVGLFGNRPTSVDRSFRSGSNHQDSKVGRSGHTQVLSQPLIRLGSRYPAGRYLSLGNICRAPAFGLLTIQFKLDAVRFHHLLVINQGSARAQLASSQARSLSPEH